MTCDWHFRPIQLHITHHLQEINLSKQDATGVGALLHAMLPQLASLSLGGGCGPEASTTTLSELAQAAGGVLPLHTLHLERASLIAITPIVGSLRKLSLGSIFCDARSFESLLAHAQQLQELEVLRLPPPGCAWVSPSLQKLSFMSKLEGYPVCALHLRGVLCGDLLALREVQVWFMDLHASPHTEEGASAVEVLRACLSSALIDFRICGLSLGEVVGNLCPLQPWLQPIANLFADRTQAACVEHLKFENTSYDAGDIEKLASIFPREAQTLTLADPYSIARLL